MRWRTYVLFVALLSLCMIQAKPVDNTSNQEERSEENTNGSENAASNENNDSLEETTESKNAGKFKPLLRFFVIKLKFAIIKL